MEFPLLSHHPDLVYLDTAATSLKPASVIQAVSEYATEYGTNAARGLYPLAESTSARVEEIRAHAARFFGAKAEEMIFTSGTTAGLNLAAEMLRDSITSGDEILASALEHHSNFLPWKMLAKRAQASFQTVPVTADGFIDRAELEKMLTPRTRVVALSAASNVLGTIQDIAFLAKLVRRSAPQALLVVDAAQLAGKRRFKISDWDADIVAVSGHKFYAPTGTGLLFIRETLQEELSKAALGGGMVLDALADPPEWKSGPAGFEAGTLNLSGIFGLGAALDFLETSGLEKIAAHDEKLTHFAIQKLETAFGKHVHILGTPDAEKRVGIVSFTLENTHPHDLASFLGERGICIRAGEHCAAPLHRALHVAASSRLSFGIYTTETDIEKAITALAEAYSFFAA
ncbi:MAG: cysteine desulfurase [Candidatus Moraniibacteriota bacterium]